MNSEGDSNRLSHIRQVICMECGVDLPSTSLVAHMETQHVILVCSVATTTLGMIHAPLVEYRSVLLRKSPSIFCLVEGCPGRATNSPNLRIHFMHRHVEDTILILSEVAIPHPRCDQYDIFIPREALATGHLGTAIWAEQKSRRIVSADAQEKSGTKFREWYHVL